MQKLTGQCLCGAISYEINGELGPVVNCHCLKCRRWHGAAFSLLLPTSITVLLLN